MNRTTHEPDKSVGGTFRYDAAGRFVHHTPPTSPASTPAPAQEPDATPIVDTESAPADAPAAAPAATPHRKRGFNRGNQE